MSLKAIQTQVIAVLAAAKIATPANAPIVIKEYAGQLRNPKGLVKFMPSLYVSVIDAEVSSDDVLGRGAALNDVLVDFVLFSKNDAGAGANASSILDLIDWTTEALKGKTITINGCIWPISSNLKIASEQDFDPAVAIVTSRIKAI